MVNTAYVYALPVSELRVNERLAFLGKVYGFLLLSLLTAACGVLIGLQPVVLHLVGGHYVMFSFAEIGLLWAAGNMMHKPGLNKVALFGFTFFSGVVLGPVCYSLMAVAGGSPILIYKALGLTGTIFIGLTVYVHVTKSDFSYLGSSLIIGLITLLVLTLFYFVFPSNTLDLIVSGVGAALFSGFVLYDTSRIMHKMSGNQYVESALMLYLHFLNLFLIISRWINR